MSSPELDRLLVDNLADLEAAATRVYALESTVFKALDEAVEEWAKRKGWIGDFDYLDDELWLAPAHWQIDAQDPGVVDADAWFTLDPSRDAIEDAPGEDIFSLSRFCGVGQAKLGFRFKQSRWKGRARAWSARVQAGEAGAAPAMIQEPGGTFFLPVQASPDALKEGLTIGVLDEVLEPFIAALDRLADCVDFFDQLLGPRAGEH